MNRGSAMALQATRDLRAGLSGPVATVLLKAAGGLVLLALWEIVVRALAPAYVARPTGIARVFFEVLADGQFLADAGATLWAVIEGLIISIVAGTLVGTVMGRVAAVEQGLR